MSMSTKPKRKTKVPAELEAFKKMVAARGCNVAITWPFVRGKRLLHLRITPDHAAIARATGEVNQSFVSFTIRVHPTESIMAHLGSVVFPSPTLEEYAAARAKKTEDA